MDVPDIINNSKIAAKDKEIAVKIYDILKDIDMGMTIGYVGWFNYENNTFYIDTKGEGALDLYEEIWGQIWNEEWNDIKIPKLSPKELERFYNKINFVNEVIQIVAQEKYGTTVKFEIK